MKKSLLMIVLAVLFLYPSSSTYAFYEYTDIANSSSHFEAVNTLQKNGLIGGYRVDDLGFNFFPNQPIKRTEAAAMFFRFLDLDAPEDYELIISNFKDIDETHPLVIPIAAAIKKGVFLGEAGEFKDSELNREQMATTIVRAFELSLNPNNTATVNTNNVSLSHKGSVEVLANLGITTELEDFRPKDKVTRAQFISFVYRTMKLKGFEKYTDFEPGGKTLKYHTDEYISTHIFGDSMYVNDNEIHNMVFVNSSMSLNDAKEGAKYAVAFPNTPIRTKYALITNDSLKKQLTYRIRDTENFAKELSIYDYSNPNEVPLPDGLTSIQVEHAQQQQFDQLKEKYNLKVRYGAYMLYRPHQGRNFSIKQIAKLMNKEPSEVVDIINWAVKTGEIYDNGEFILYYEFGYGRLPHYKVEPK